MSFKEFTDKVSQTIICNDNESIECVWYSYSFGNIKAMFVVKKADGTINEPYYEANYRKETDDIWIATYIESDIIKL